MRNKTEKEDYSLWNNFVYLLKGIWESDRKLMAFMVLEALCMVITPFIAMYLPKIGVDLVEMCIRDRPFIAYFDRLKNYLLNGELLFVSSGYSFYDQHINDIIFNCLRQNARLYMVVLCFSDDQVEYMKDYGKAYLNLCVLGPKMAITNGKLYEWKYDDSEDVYKRQGYIF